jgi:hypothetical protein
MADVILPPDTSLAPLFVEHDAVYVTGAPLHVAITIRAARPGLSFGWLPSVSPYTARGAIGCTLSTTDGRVAFARDPASLTPELIEDFAFELRGTEQRRMLTDLSELFGEDVPPPGTYWLTIRYEALLARLESAPVGIRLREPSLDEGALLESARSEVPPGTTWGQWSYLHRAAAPVALRGPAELRGDPLRFNRIAKRLYTDPTPLGPVDFAALDALEGLYAPDRAALAAEMFATTDPAAYARQAELVRREFPALGWWIDMLDAGGGILRAPKPPMRDGHGEG